MECSHREGERVYEAKRKLSRPGLFPRKLVLLLFLFGRVELSGLFG